MFEKVFEIKILISFSKLILSTKNYKNVVFFYVFHIFNIKKKNTQKNSLEK